MLLAAGMFAMTAPAFAQPENLLTPLSVPTGQSTMSGSSHPSPFLAAAHDDVEKHRWRSAEGALERSETVLLNNGVRSSAGVATSPSPAMPYIIQARVAVRQHDEVDALVAIDKADKDAGYYIAPVPPVIIAQAPVASVSAATSNNRVASAAPGPMVTRALLPGHWQLAGWQYHWVPPDTAYRAVQSNPFIPGHYVYRGGAWIWVTGHYGNSGA